MIAPALSIGVHEDEKDIEKALYYLQLAAFRDSDARALRTVGCFIFRAHFS